MEMIFKMRVFFLFFICFNFLIASNFFKSENIVVDINKNLMWQDDEDVKIFKSNWSQAKEYCRSLTLNGYTDWKLPTIKELQTIVDISNKKPAINEQFKFCQTTSYWSNNQDIKDKNYAWYVGFETGATFIGSKDYDCYVRCIRQRFKK